MIAQCLGRLLPLGVCLTALAVSLSATAEPGEQVTKGRQEPGASLSETDRAWLAEVEFLMSDKERAAFLALRRQHRRREFIERFWQVRDPFPSSTVNEFHQEWLHRLEIARDRFGGIESDRGRAVLLGGPPDMVHRNLCPELLSPNEVWVYRDAGPSGAALIFAFRPNPTSDPYRIWSPLDGISALASSRVLLGFDLGQLVAGCSRPREVEEIFLMAVDFKRFVTANEWLPVPSTEWVTAFVGRSTDLPEDAPLLDAHLEVLFPGRYQGRIVVQSLITIDKSTAELTGTAEKAPQHASSQVKGSYNFLVDGEILRGEDLSERFRYRFDLPSEAIAESRLPLLLQRHLRPGRYRQILRVHDLNGERFFRDERILEVPSLERVRTASRATAVPGSVPSSAPPSAPLTTPVPLPSEITRSARSLLRAALPDSQTSDTTLKLLPLPDRMLTGLYRVKARVSGEGIAKVAFFLDGKRVAAKRRPPFSLELNFGESPRSHVLEAVGFDSAGTEIARDQLPVNSGPQRFSIRLLEPLTGGRYADGLRARAEVNVPRGETLDRVELYLNEILLATLYQPPFVQPVLLPSNQRITYVRAVAFLEDGNSAEDLVVINGPENLDHVEINFVELYTSVVDRKGNNIEGLVSEDFTVLEDSVEQQIRRVEYVVDLPVHAALILDTSTSMKDHLEQAERAAMHFFERVIQPKDRAAVVLFNDQPELKVPLTNSHEVLAGSLAGMISEGETALYDSVVFGLYYLSGLRGKRALILLTDGEDSSSKYSFNDALDFARQSGVAIYAIGLGFEDRSTPAFNHTRGVLRHLATATGGAYYPASETSQLASIYSRIEGELRSQYLIAYQSTQTEGDNFRQVEVQVARHDLKTKTIPGYLP